MNLGTAKCARPHDSLSIHLAAGFLSQVCSNRQHVLTPLVQSCSVFCRKLGLLVVRQMWRTGLELLREEVFGPKMLEATSRLLVRKRRRLVINIILLLFVRRILVVYHKGRTQIPPAHHSSRVWSRGTNTFIIGFPFRGYSRI